MINKAYIYPITNRNQGGILNPYLDNFMQSMAEEVIFINKNSPSDIGILNLFKYISGKLNYVFLNWIEDLPDKKLGKFQCILLVYVLFPVLHLKKTKIVWTLHNKLSHYAINIDKKKWLLSKLVIHSDVILTHASEGVKFIQGINPSAGKKVVFLHHPVNDLKLPNVIKKKNIDFLIWGTIQPYKGLVEFFKLFNQIPDLSKFKIVIAGKVPDKNYLRKLEEVLPNTVELKNKYIPFDILEQMMYESKIILFTYKSDSILSSGALMDSLITGTKILGPETGAFIDLKKAGLVDTYTKVSELIKILEEYNNGPNIDSLKKFWNMNNWKAFGKRLLKEINE
jgi:glycosyltransferase involved in cell wall biosynthesis